MAKAMTWISHTSRVTTSIMVAFVLVSLGILREAQALTTLTRNMQTPRARKSASLPTKETATRNWERVYINLTGFPFPLGPFVARRTVLDEIVAGRVWSIEQEQTLFGIRVNVRSVAIKLRSGDLWIYNPVAPTKELVELLTKIPFGKVAHIVLGTTQYEHKVFVGAFARRFPEAAVHCVPDQWSFPLDLPPRLLGIPTTRQERTGPGVLDPDAEYAWGDEFDLEILRPESRLAGNYAAVEAAFVHKDTKTLVLTDAIVYVPKSPPAIVDVEALNYLSRTDSWVLNAAALLNWRGKGAELRAAVNSKAPPKPQSGWQRNALLALTFGPSPESLVDPSSAFDTIAERWLVAPVCNSLVYASERVRPALKTWVDQIAKLDFVRIAPAHFAVARCTPAQFKAAFEPLLQDNDLLVEDKRPFNMAQLRRQLGFREESPFPQSDVKLINDLADFLRQLRVI